MKLTETEQADISGAITSLGFVVHQTAVEKGWWDSPREFGDILSNIHAELSEAWEGYRHKNPPSDHIPEYTAIEEELADVIIRIMDYAAANELRIGDAIIAKMAFNDGREYRHGGKIA